MRPIKIKILFWVLLWPLGWIVNALMGEILATPWTIHHSYCGPLDFKCLIDGFVIFFRVIDNKSFSHLLFNLFILEIYVIRCFQTTSCYQKGSTEDFLFFPDDLKHICTKKANRLVVQFIFCGVVCISNRSF